MDDCDCLNECGDDPWIKSGRSMPCEHRRETQARIAALTTAAPAAVAGPSDHELDSLIQKFFGWMHTIPEGTHRAFAREVLAQFGAAPTTQPASQQEATDALARAEYYIDNPSAWSSFDQRVSDDISAVTKALRAALTTPQQEAPADELEEVLHERDDAEDFINELLDEVLGVDRPEWSNAYNRYDAMNDVRERITALHKPAVDKAWGRFESAMAEPQPSPASQGDALTQAARDVLAERRRQISAEGWTPEHDDEHLPGELALAAASYVCADEGDAPPAIWPWDWSWWKPGARRRNLVKSGALILAELERMDRADAARAAQEGK